MRMIEKNKTIWIVAAVIVVLGLVFGGTLLTRPPEEPRDVALEPVEREPAIEEPVEIVTIQFVGWEASPLETESVREGLNTFMTQNPNIKVEYTPVPHAEYETKLLTSMAGGAGADVFFAGADLYRSLQAKNQLLDITDFFKAEHSFYSIFLE